jgi:hypothetical protein
MHKPFLEPFGLTFRSIGRCIPTEVGALGSRLGMETGPTTAWVKNPKAAVGYAQSGPGHERPALAGLTPLDGLPKWQSGTCPARPCPPASLPIMMRKRCAKRSYRLPPPPAN